MYTFCTPTLKRLFSKRTILEPLSRATSSHWRWYVEISTPTTWRWRRNVILLIGLVRPLHYIYIYILCKNKLSTITQLFTFYLYTILYIYIYKYIHQIAFTCTRLLCKTIFNVTGCLLAHREIVLIQVGLCFVLFYFYTRLVVSHCSHEVFSLTTLAKLWWVYTTLYYQTNFITFACDRPISIIQLWHTYLKRDYVVTSGWVLAISKLQI